MIITGNLIDIHSREIYPAQIKVKDKIIQSVKKVEAVFRNFIMPGLIDSHIHIESSMLTPGSFAWAAVSRGTIGVVSDPHEIANVLGIDGIKFMINDALTVPVKFFFGAPSCVPATPFESSGASINAEEIKEILKMPGINYLAEMMNFPGIIYDDAEARKKIELAHLLKKPVDGHAPGLRGEGLRKYVSAGITTDHECSTLEEAREKISHGMKILIREGSAARNLDALKQLYTSDPEMVMLCSDDLHPEMLLRGHINLLVARLIREGYNLFDVVRSCTLNPSLHYSLGAGLMRPGDPADFIVVDDPAEMNIIQTWIDGRKVFENGKVLFDYNPGVPVNRFNCNLVSKNMITVPRMSDKIRVIVASDGELLTGEELTEPTGEYIIDPDIPEDILKIIVKDRYRDAPPAVGFIKGFGLKRGAFASSVAHDSHNIIAIGTTDEDLVTAVNEVIKLKGGLAVCDNGKINSFQLKIAGIMSDRPCSEVADDYEKLSEIVKSMGCPMSAPFMTLSFMALLVIPELKLSDKGLFDGRRFQFVSLFL